MTLLKNGTSLKINTNAKVRWIKLAFALVLSNVFFFLIFSEGEKKIAPSTPTGWVEVKLEAQLMTPFQNGKKVLLLNRSGRKKLEAVLQAESAQDLKLTVLVKESDAHELFEHSNWEIMPFIQKINFASNQRGEHFEITY